MKLLPILACLVALMTLVAIFFWSDPKRNEPISASPEAPLKTIVEDEPQEREQKIVEEVPYEEPDNPIDKIVQTFGDHMNFNLQLETLDDFTDTEILEIWDILIKEKEILRTGFKDLYKFESDAIVNELLNRLYVMQIETSTEDEMERASSIFKHLTLESGIDDVFRDYAIQRSVLWITDDDKNPYREEVFNNILSNIINENNQGNDYMGTAVNMLLSSDDSWTEDERKVITEHMQLFVDTMPAINELRDEVSIPLIHALDTWSLEGREEVYKQGLSNGNEYLQFVIKSMLKRDL